MVEDIGEKKDQQITDLRDKNENLIKELSDLKTNSITEMATLSQKIQKLEDEKDDLQEKFFSADAKAESLKSDMKAKQCSIDQLKQNLQSSQKNLDERTSEILQLKNEIQILKDSSKDSLSSEQTKALSMQATIDTLQVKIYSTGNYVKSQFSRLMWWHWIASGFVFLTGTLVGLGE